MSAFKKSHPITGYKWSGRGCELCFMTSKPPPFTVINPTTHDEGRGECNNSISTASIQSMNAAVEISFFFIRPNWSYPFAFFSIPPWLCVCLSESSYKNINDGHERLRKSIFEFTILLVRVPSIWWPIRFPFFK